MTDLEATRCGLINIRDRRGADTPPGHRCSNAVEILQMPPHPVHLIQYFTIEGEEFFRNRHKENLERQTGDLKRLLADGE